MSTVPSSTRQKWMRVTRTVDKGGKIVQRVRKQLQTGGSSVGHVFIARLSRIGSPGHTPKESLFREIYEFTPPTLRGKVRGQEVQQEIHRLTHPSITPISRETASGFSLDPLAPSSHIMTSFCTRGVPFSFYTMPGPGTPITLDGMCGS